MSWHLKGSYAETCSCELMCPCNFSFDHGATYDYCRAALVFNIKEGEIDGTDVSGLKAAFVIDTPKVMTDGQLAARRVHRRPGDRRAGGEAHRRLQRADGRPDGGARPAGRRDARRRARADRDRRRRPAPQRQGRRRDRLRDRGHRPLRRRDGRARPAHRHVPPGRLDADRRRGDALEDQRVRDRVRGQDRPLDGRVLLGARDRVAAPAAASLAPAFAAARTRLGLVALLFALAGGCLVVDGRPDAGDGRRPVDRASGRSAGSSASGW